MLGERTAEEVKMTLGSAFPTATRSPRPRSAAATWSAGCPRTVVVSSAEVRKALEEPLHAIVDAVRATLDQTPPELAGDIMDRGIVLTGGGALLRGLDERLRHETGMPVHVAEDPLLSRRHGRRQVRRGVRGASSRCWSRSAGGTDAAARRARTARGAPAAARLPPLRPDRRPARRPLALRSRWSPWCWPA